MVLKDIQKKTLKLNTKYQEQLFRINANSSKQKFYFDPSSYYHILRLYRYQELKQFLKKYQQDLSGKHIAILGCGNGLDIYLIKHIFGNLKFTAIDFSEIGLQSVRSHFPSVDTVQANMEDLDFDDDSFDFALVPIALHHLQQPYRGIYEAIRISKYGAILIEPLDSLLVRIATWLGLAKRYEKFGNYVFRINIREMRKIAKSMFIDMAIKPYMCLHYTAKNKFDYILWRVFNRISDIAAPLVANEVIVYFRKDMS